jgi:hypothetical protein
MSYVIAAPEALASAASGVAGIRSSLSEANVAPAAPTKAVVAAAGDEVWAAYNDVRCSGSPATVDRTPRGAFKRPF